MRLLRPLLVAILLCLLATVGYAFYQTRIRPDAGITAVQAENLIVQVNQTHPISTDDDVREMNITVDYAFADSNRIVVGYHVTGSAKASDAVQIFTNPTLTDDTGHSYYWIPTSGQQASNPTGEGTDPEAFMPFRTEGLISFDSSVWDTAPASLNLNLRIEVAYSSTSIQESQPYAMKMAGETTFQFSIPFNPGRTAILNLSATAGPITLQLQKVVIAPSLTRLEICAPQAIFASDDDNWLSWLSSVVLDVNGQRIISTSEASFAGLHGRPIERQSGCRALVIPAQLVGQTGVWELTINDFTNTGSGEHLSGPWVFSFHIPS